MTIVPVYRLAKPKPKTDSAGIPLKSKVQAPKTDVQGVPLKSKTQTPKTVQKMPSSTPVKPEPAPEYRPISTNLPDDDPYSDPAPPLDDESQTSYYGGVEPEPSPEQPFHVLEEQTFPISEIGADATPLLDRSSPLGFENGPHHFAEATLGDAYPQSARAERMRQIIESAYNNPTGIKSRAHQQQVKDTDIPLGHVRIGPLIPDEPRAGHIVRVHYPQGIVTTYRARLDGDGNSYK